MSKRGRVAEEFIEQLRAAVRTLRIRPALVLGEAFIDDQIRCTTDQVFGLDANYKVMPKANPELLRREFEYVVGDSVRIRMWERTGVVYDLDADMWEKLGTMKPGQKVWTHTFRNIRHPNPFLLFPTPIRLDDPDGTYILMHGVFIAGAVSGSRGFELRSLTTRPFTHISLMFGGLIYNADGTPRYMSAPRWLPRPGFPQLGTWVEEPTRVQVTAWQSVSVDITNRPALLRDLVEVSVQRFSQNAHDTTTDRHRHLTMLLGRTLAALMYLCTSNLDIEQAGAGAPPKAKRKAPAKGKAPAKAKARPNQTYKVGYRIGAKIRLFNEKKKAARNSDGSTLIGGTTSGRRSPDPYNVLPFFRGYWCKARACTCPEPDPESHLETRFIEGYWAATDSLTEDNGPAEITVHKITE